jgi:hypothetical protein
MTKVDAQVLDTVQDALAGNESMLSFRAALVKIQKLLQDHHDRP